MTGTLADSVGRLERRSAMPGRFGRRRATEFIGLLGYAAGHGVPMLEALRNFDPGLWYVGGAYDRFWADLNRGAALSTALAHLRRHLPADFLAAVYQAEQRQRLEEVLPLLATRSFRDDDFSRKIRWILVYQLIHLLILLPFALGVAVFVMPVFREIMTGQELSHSVVPAMETMQKALILLLGCLASASAALLLVLFLIPLEGWMFIGYYLPLFGPPVRMLGKYEFARSMVCSLACGEDIEQALRFSTVCCRSLWLRRKLRRTLANPAMPRSYGERIAGMGVFSPLEQSILSSAFLREDPEAGFREVQRCIVSSYDEKLKMLPVKMEFLFLALRGFLVASIVLTIGLTLVLLIQSSLR